MGQELLVTEHVDAGTEFVREFNDDYPVSVAFWVNPTETDNLFLYVASDKIDGNNIDVAYGEALQRLHGKNSPWLDPFQVKLVNSNDPIARDAIEIRDRYATTTMFTRSNRFSIGGIGIDALGIYPTVSAMKSTP